MQDFLCFVWFCFANVFFSGFHLVLNYDSLLSFLTNFWFFLRLMTIYLVEGLLYKCKHFFSIYIHRTTGEI